MLLIVGWPCLALGAGLRLECEIGGEMLPLATVSKDSLLVRRGEALVPAPEAAIWHLTGDLVENARLVRWAPRHKLKARPLAEYNGFQRVIETEIVVDAKKNVLDAEFTLSDWPDAQSADSAVVAVWLINGKPAKVQVRPLESPINNGFAGEFHLLLSPAEAQGQPALLLWEKDAFLPPLPEYSNGPTQRAFLSVLTDDVSGLRDALTAGAKLNKKSRT